MGCLQKLTLLAKYHQETWEYSESVSQLKEFTAAIPVMEWMLLWDLAKRTLTNCQAAQRCLERHIVEHGC